MGSGELECSYLPARRRANLLALLLILQCTAFAGASEGERVCVLTLLYTSTTLFAVRATSSKYTSCAVLSNCVQQTWSAAVDFVCVRSVCFDSSNQKTSLTVSSQFVSLFSHCVCARVISVDHFHLHCSQNACECRYTKWLPGHVCIVWVGIESGELAAGLVSVNNPCHQSCQHSMSPFNIGLLCILRVMCTIAPPVTLRVCLCETSDQTLRQPS